MVKSWVLEKGKRKLKARENRSIPIAEDNDGKIYYVNDANVGKNEVECEHPFPIPYNDPTQKQRIGPIVVTGASGTGKSYRTTMMLSDMPKKRKFLFTLLKTDDPAHKDIGLRRVDNEKLRAFIEKHGIAALDDEFKDSVCVFDDFEAPTTEKKYKKDENMIFAILNRFGTYGRHADIDVLVCIHNLFAGQRTACLNTESTAYVLFPNSDRAQVRKILNKKFGMSIKQVNELMAIDDSDTSRVIYANKKPQYIIDRNFIKML